MIDIDSFIKTLDLVFMIVFWSVLGLLLVYFLVGLLYGWKHGTYRFLFLSIMTVALLACSGMIANTVGQINLATWLHQPLRFMIRETVIEVSPGPLFDMVKEGVFKILKDAFKVQSSIDALLNYSTAISASILRYVTIILIGITVATVGSLLSFLLWHILFKHFIPKPARKRRLLIISGIEGLLVGAMCLVLTIAPLSGMVNAVHSHVDYTKLNDKNETVQMYQKVMETYDNSILNKAFFSWTKGSGKDTLDTQLTEFLSQAQYENMSANIVTEVRSLASVGGGFFALMGNSVTKNETDSLALLPIQIVGQSLVQMLTLSGDDGLDVLADVSALATSLSRDTVALSSATSDTALSFARGNEKSYLNRCYHLYRDLTSSGFIPTEVDPSRSLRAYPEIGNLYDALTSDASLRSLEEAMASPSSSRLVESVLRGYVYDRSADADLKTLLPEGKSDTKAIASYPYLQDAYAVVKTFHGLNRLDAGLTKSLVGRIHQADSSAPLTDTDLLNSALAAFAKDHRELIRLLVGERDVNDEPIVNDKGLSAGGCLLDSGLVNVAFPVGMEIVSALLNDSLLKDHPEKVDLSKAAIALQNADGTPNYVNNKREFGAMLDVAGDMLENPYAGSTDETLLAKGEVIVTAAKNLFYDFKTHVGIDMNPEGGLHGYDPNLFKALANGFRRIDGSTMFSAAMPVLADRFLKQADVLSNFNIETIDTSPEAEGKPVLGRELAKFLTLGAQCHSVFPIFLRPGNFTLDSIAQALNAHGSEFLKVLDVFADSLILNPVIDQVTNVNMTKVFNYLFDSIKIENKLAFDDLDGIEMVSTYAKPVSIVDSYDGEPSDYHENAFMVGAVSRVMASGVLDRLTDMASTNDIASHLVGCDMKEIFASIGQSVVLRKVLPGYFDSKVLDPLLNNDNKLVLKPMGITFRNLISEKDWADEGERFQTLIDLAARGLDLSNFDLFKDGTALIDLMNQMSGSMMFQPLASSIESPDPSLVIPAEETGDGTTRYYSFPAYFAEKILASAGANAHYFEDETPVGDTSLERCSAFYESCLQLNRPSVWQKNGTKTGEFDALDAVFVDLKSLGSFDALSKIEASNLPAMRSALSHISASYSFSTVFVANALTEALNKVDAGDDIDFHAAYPAYFYDVHRDPATYDKEAAYAWKKTEIDHLMDTLDTIYDENYGLVDSAGKIDVSGIKIKDVSSDQLLRPMLLSAHRSKVFHPDDEALGSRASAYHAAHDATVFQQILGSITMNSGIYKIDNSRADMTWRTPLDEAVDKGGLLLGYPSKESVYSIITSLPDASWEGADGEIERLCGLIDFIQATDFIDGDGNLSTDAFTDIASYFGYDLTTKLAKRVEMNGLFTHFNDVEIFRRALPYYLTDAIERGDYGESIGKDIQCADFYFTLSLSGDDYGAYGPDDINDIVDVMFYLSSCSSADPNNIASLDAQALSEALSTMYESGPFDSNKSKADAVFDIDPADPKYPDYEAKKGHTCFENLLADLIATDALSEYYFYADSPKDQAHAADGDYDLAMGKALYYIGQVRTLQPDEMDDHIREFCDFIEILGSPTLSPYVSGGSSTDFASMDGTVLSLILHGLNDAYFLRDVVPNALHSNLWKGTYDILGVDLSLTNVFFSYEWVDENGDLKAIHSLDYEVPFYEPEIDQVCYVVDALKNNKSNMSEFDVSFVDPMIVRTMLFDLYNSYIFHEAGPNKAADGHYSETWEYYRAEDGYGFAKESESATTGTLFRQNDLTIFEQFIQKIYIDSGLAQQNLELTQSAEDLELYLEAREGTRGIVKHLPDLSSADYDDYLKAAGLFKIHDAIAAFEEGTLEDVSGAMLTTDWGDEISALTTDGHRHHPGVDRPGEANDANVGLVETVQRLGFKTADVELGDVQLNKYQPFELYALFQALNGCQVGNAIMPNTLARFVSGKSDSGIGLGFHVYSDDVMDLPDGLTLSFDVSGDGFGMPDKLTFDYAGTASSIHLYYGLIDVTELVSMSHTGTTYTLNLAKLPGGFEVQGDGTNSFTNASVEFDCANYRQDQATYREKAIASVYYFFTSTFRGNVDPSSVKYYYSFDEGSSELANFLKDDKCTTGFQHSTFGLFSMIADSGLFETKLHADAFTAKDFVLYNLFHVTAEVPVGGVPVPVSLGMGDEFGTFGSTDRYDAATGIYAVTSAESDMKEFCFREAAYFDQFIDDIGFLDAMANKSYYENATSSTPTPAVARASESYLLSDPTSEAYEHLYDALDSSKFTAKTVTLYGTKEGAGNPNFITQSDAYEEPGAFAQGILYGIAKKLSYSYNAFARLDSHPGLFVGAPASGDRSVYFSSDAVATLADGECGLTSVASAFDRSDDKLDVMQSLKKAYKSLEAYHGGDDASLASAISDFAKGNDSASVLLQQFYLGDLYDCLASALDGNFDSSNVYYDYRGTGNLLGGVNKAFSYSEVASIVYP